MLKLGTNYIYHSFIVSVNNVIGGKDLMKKRVAFVVDSTVYLTDELRHHPDIYVVPQIIIANNKELEDGIDIQTEELYEIIQNSKDVPKTSQPNVGKFAQLYDKLKEEYESAIAIHVSSKLSGTLQSSTAGKNESGFAVEVVDSSSLSYGITHLLELGLSLVEKNMDYVEIAKVLREESKKGRNLILLGTLEQLYKGGRMTGIQFVLGNLLNIKPILTINENGELVLKERIRSDKKATRRMIELLKETCEKYSVKKVAVMHGNALEKAKEIKKIIQNEIPGIKTLIGDISSSLAVHAGGGAVAIFWFQN